MFNLEDEAYETVEQKTESKGHRWKSKTTWQLNCEYTSVINRGIKPLYLKTNSLRSAYKDKSDIMILIKRGTPEKVEFFLMERGWLRK